MQGASFEDKILIYIITVDLISKTFFYVIEKSFTSYLWSKVHVKYCERLYVWVGAAVLALLFGDRNFDIKNVNIKNLWKWQRTLPGHIDNMVWYISRDFLPCKNIGKNCPEI